MAARTDTDTDERTHAARSFWLTAASFLVVMSFMTVPTPLYGLYEERNGFGPFTVTLVFAAFGAGVVLGLVLLGHVSDHVGRRRLLLGVVVLEAACAVGFAAGSATWWLLVLRFLTGLGVGGCAPTATAYLLELHACWRPGAAPVLGRTVANVANLGGLAIGPLVASLASLLPRPLSTPYVVYVMLLVGVGVALRRVPETVSGDVVAAPWRYRPQRLVIDREVRAPFVGAAVAAFSSFAVLAFITALTGQFLVQVVGTTSRVVTGAIVTTVLAGGVVSQVVLSRAARRRQLQVGAALVTGGVVVMAGAGQTGALAAYVVGGFLTAGGVGLVFSASVATVSGLAAPERRAGTLATLFAAAYVGLTVPVVVIGALLTALDVTPVLTGLAALVALAVPAGIAMLVRQSD
ncbi:MFS transporter [Nocardioides rubriscoriae]|uniref:MFS transporter n=1 Tax=Nocardioides rubriscoriae TaxID=642762 RepID=UPI0011DF997B|nr:MFS transporter [Nocardioides rubriscoriae]